MSRTRAFRPDSTVLIRDDQRGSNREALAAINLAGKERFGSSINAIFQMLKESPTFREFMARGMLEASWPELQHDGKPRRTKRQSLRRASS